MHARIARFEGSDPQALDGMIEAVKADVPKGPPEGVPAVEMMMLVDRQSGTGLGITFYESEEDLRQGDQTLNEMSPPTDPGSGRRTSVEMYEVAVRASA